MDVRALCVSEQLCRASHLAGGRLDSLGSSVGLRRAKVDAIGFEDAVHHCLGNIEVNHPGASGPADACRTPKELREPVERRHRTAPLRHRASDARLVEVLIRTAAIRIRDRRPPARRDQKHSVALTVFDGDAGEDVRNSRTVGSHAHAKLAGEPCVRASHVRGAGFVPRRDHTDAVLLEARKETHVRAVDDAEHDLDPFGSQHASQRLSSNHLRHGDPSCVRMP
jgi:hypothetical protein